MELSRRRLRAACIGLGYHAPLFPALVRALRPRVASARYCYSVWLRHLVTAHEHGLRPSLRGVVVEIGPGDSLGVGLAALLSGAERYYAIDAVRHSAVSANLPVLDELASLFERREPIPDDSEFPDVHPKLSAYAFPEFLDIPRPGADRVREIAESIRDPDSDDSLITYVAPYDHPDFGRESFADLVISQATMEHVADLEGLYRAMHAWLRPGGIVSHEIDYQCHGTSSRWNGHWAYSDLGWRLTWGGRLYPLNMEPHSTHARLLRQCGYCIVTELRTETPSSLRRNELNDRYKRLSDEDLATSGAIIQARKP